MGSLAWMAPEVLTNPKKFSHKSDVYSYGVILWELFTNGRNPCPSALTHVTLANKVINESWRPSLPHTCPVEWASFIETCWSQTPSKRPAFKNIVEFLKRWEDNPPPIRKEASGDSSGDWDRSSQNNTEQETTEEEILSETTISQSNADYDDVIS